MKNVQLELFLERYDGKPITEKEAEDLLMDALEKLDNDGVREWNATQNAHTRSVLDQIAFRDDIARDLTRLFSATSADYYDLTHVQDYVFAMKLQPPLAQPMLVRLDRAAAAAV